MTIILSSPVPGVMIRWETLLKGHCKIKKALSIEQLRSLCGNRQFDVILLHRMLIDISSFRTLRSAFPAARFFLLTDHPDEEEALAFLRLGIVGYANTYIAAPRLLQALRVITEGGVWLGQKIIQRLITGVSNTLKPEDKKRSGPAAAGKPDQIPTQHCRTRCPWTIQSGNRSRFEHNGKNGQSTSDIHL